MDTVTDFVAAGSFADMAENVIYESLPDYAQLVRTTDLKSNFSNNNFVYVNKKAFDFLWRVNLDTESIIMPNIGNCGEIYYVNKEILPYKHNVLGPNAILVRSQNQNNKFLSVSFLSDDFQKKIKLIVSPNGQTKFNKTELKTLDVIIPSVNEQIKVGTLFDSLDSLITLHQRKYDKLVYVKKALLDKMFPKNGELVPRLRFKGFTETWELCKLGDIGTFKSNGVDKLSKPNEIPVNLLNYMDVYNRRKISNNNASELMQVTAKQSQLIENNILKNDVFFTPTSETPEDIGRVFVIEETLNNTVYSYHLMRYRPNNGVFYPNFPNYSLMTSHVRNQFFISAKGVQRYVVSKVDFEAIENYIPKYTEQAKIGEMFRTIDSLITLHQRKYEKLVNIKKALLQKMFV